MTCAGMSQTMAVEDAFNGTNGRQWLSVLLFQRCADGFRTTKESLIIKVEPHTFDDSLYFSAIEVVVYIHRRF